MPSPEQLDPVVEQRLDAYIATLDQRPSSLPGDIRVIDTELTSDEAGMKIVFSATREDGKVATFETGSFKDNGGNSELTDRHDICVSTAGGCTRNCEFCSVPKAALGFERLLTAEEMVTQALYAIALRNRDGAMPNVIGLMGNGEPPDNMAVIPAVTFLAQRSELDLKRIIFSTIGEALNNINKIATSFSNLDAEILMQFSLHAADEQKRRVIVPGRKPLSRIMEAVDGYGEATGDPVKFNVVLMNGVDTFEGFTNVSPEDAKRLAELLQSSSTVSGDPIKRILKLSAYNSIPGIPFVAPPEEAVDVFAGTLAEEGITGIQWFRGSGRDIDDQKTVGGFACGQLRATTKSALSRAGEEQAASSI
jgi:adenine C2-methylase RlmN of 23S rRNA A2503 and tRNA A37